MTLGVGSLKKPFNFWVVQVGKSTWGLIRVCSLCRKRDDDQKWQMHQWKQAGWEDWSGWQEAGWEDWSGWQDWSHHHDDDDDDDHDAGDPEPTPKSKKETLDKKWLDLSCPILTS